MNHLIFTASYSLPWDWRVPTEPGTFGPSPEGLGHRYYDNPSQLNSSRVGSWPPLVLPHSTISVAAYTSIYYVLIYFEGSLGRYNTHAKVFQWLMTIGPNVTALAGFQFANLLPYLLQVVPTIFGFHSPVPKPFPISDYSWLALGIIKYYFKGDSNQSEKGTVGLGWGQEQQLRKHCVTNRFFLDGLNWAGKTIWMDLRRNFWSGSQFMPRSIV
ncbi:hypothetical protein DSO57_1017327 [Entomophthora muscae]|uniref:Uncharacterized protein n=1 Tax=Entomophthora muscae TaxID=34485 RepID=A0ACC2RW09_9FUNG|nr:hypothetical protein DSO57_1017327 [Entomophthora muscae]